MDTLAKTRGSPEARNHSIARVSAPASPMDMTIQPLRRYEPQQAPRFASMRARRAFILAGTAVLTAAGCYEMYEVLQDRRHHGPGVDHPRAVRAAVRVDRVFIRIRPCRLRRAGDAQEE